MARQAPHIVGSSTYTASVASTSSFTIAVPGTSEGVTLRNGDVLVVGYRTNGSTSPSDFANAAFTRRGKAFAASNTNDRVFGLHTHVVTDVSTEPAAYTFTKTVADTRTVAFMCVVRGADVTALITGESVGYNTAGNASRFTAFTTSAGPGITIAIWVNEITSPNSNIPTAFPPDFTQIAQKGSSEGTGSTRSSLWAGALAYTTPGTVGPVDLSWSVISGPAATAFAMYGADTANAPAEALAAATATSSAAAAHVTAVMAPVAATAVASAAVAGVTPTRTANAPLTLGATATATWRPGFPNVTHLIATQGATLAHRGGSSNFPEFSQYAYEQSALRGYGALEFSCGWSSDNIPFGLGDQYLDRTAGVTGNVDPKTLTWATIQANYQNTLNSGGTPRPYYRLVDFLDTFTPTHVVAVDPKYGIVSNALLDLMLDICDAHGGPTKIIIKFDAPGGGGINLATKARARGYKVMNYWGTDTAALATEQQNFDLLGLLYNGASSVWDAGKQHGKPLWGAVIPNQAGYDTAIANGARLAMVRDVVNIRPVSVGSISTASTPLTATAVATTTESRTADATLTLTSTAAGTQLETRTAPAFLTLSATTAAAPAETRSAPAPLTSTATAVHAPRLAAGARLDLAATAAADTAGGTATRTGAATLDLAATSSHLAREIRAAASQLTLTAAAAPSTREARFAAATGVLNATATGARHIPTRAIVIRTRSNLRPLTTRS